MMRKINKSNEDFGRDHPAVHKAYCVILLHKGDAEGELRKKLSGKRTEVGRKLWKALMADWGPSGTEEATSHLMPDTGHQAGKNLSGYRTETHSGAFLSFFAKKHGFCSFAK